MDESKAENKEEEITFVLRFLEQTREGVYAEITDAGTPYLRIRELAQPAYYCGEEFIYGIS